MVEYRKESECGVVVIVHGHDGCGASVRCGLGK